MIPQKNLSLLANRLASGGKRMQEYVLERDYCISWFLAGLDNSALKEKIVFKGGTSLKKCHFMDYRFSEDLDFTLTDDIAFDDIRTGLEPAFQYVLKQANIKMSFSRLDKDSHQNSHTFYLAYEGPLPKGKPRELKTDITIKEKMIYPAAVKMLLSYPDYGDIPAGVGVRTYSLEEIASEKATALLDKARNEPRDLYDMWFLFTHGHIDGFSLSGDVERKLEFRGKKLAEVKGEFDRKEIRLSKYWDDRLGNQMTAVPSFDEVFRTVKREFKKAGLTG
jgi:predicted nucleotidyltransferase component of viral defense system